MKEPVMNEVRLTNMEVSTLKKLMDDAVSAGWRDGEAGNLRLWQRLRQKLSDARQQPAALARLAEGGGD